MRNKNFAVFILTFGRPDKVYTFQTLRKCGYTGKIIILCSDDDATIPRYKELYDNVEVFSKEDYKGTFDIADNLEQDNVVVFARNANFDIAEKLGLDYFMQYDDDYYEFTYKFDDKLNYSTYSLVRNLDSIFDNLVEFQKKTAIKSVALAQCGDFFGGGNGSFGQKIFLKRKLMNTFLFKTSERVQFVGRINEDVNTYVYFGSKGDLFFTINQVAVNQKDTQTNSGGLTEFYLSTGTYYKSFYTVMFSPSCTTINMMGETRQRLHHRISWKNAVPVILSEGVKKK